MKNTGSVFVALSELFVRFPIWCFLIYVMLKAANPDRLVWFLFFVYVPLGIIDRKSVV